MSETLLITLTADGEFLFQSTLKGSNPSGEKHPTIHCPNRGKYMYDVHDKTAKNKTVCYDLADPKYKNYPRAHIRVCQKCHHRIGIMSLDPKLRRKMNLPQLHKCHEKMLYRYAQKQGEDVSIGEDTNILSYTDAFNVAGYAIPAMQWACGTGVMGGYGNGQLGPNSGASKAQAAAMRMRYRTLDDEEN